MKYSTVINPFTVHDCYSMFCLVKWVPQCQACWRLLVWRTTKALLLKSLCGWHDLHSKSIQCRLFASLFVVPGSNGNQKGHGSCSQSSALMTLALRQADRVHPIRPGLPTRSHRRTPSLCRVSSESPHLAILCDSPLRKQPNHFLVDTLISWQPVSCQFQHLNIPVCISANIGGLIVSNQSQSWRASNALQGKRSWCQSNKLRWKKK